MPSQYSLCPAITALTNGRVPEGEAGDDAGLEHLIRCGASHCRRQGKTHRDNSKEAAMSDSAIYSVIDKNGQATKSDGKLLIRRICIAIEANV